MNKEIFGWSMYDFANTIFSALFITVYFPLFIVLIGGNAFQVGLVFSISMFLAAFLVPFLGAVVDITKKKKILLFVFTVICCIFTLFTGFFGLIVALILGVLANFFYHACLEIYDAMLVDISHKKNIGYVSGIGTAVGYLGTLLAIGVAYIVGFYYGFETVTSMKILFVLIALLFFSFSLFTFIIIKEPVTTEITKKHFKEAFSRVISTIRGIKKYKFIWLFLLSSFLFLDATNTAIIFLYLYARDQLGLTVIQFLPLYAVMATSAGLGSLAFGKLTDKIGHKLTLNIILFSWIAIILLLYFKTSYTTFITVGILGGALLGAIWTVTRPMLVEIAPKSKIAELFGYHGLTEKFSGVIGPVLFGAIAIAYSFKQALLVVVGLFLLGVVTLWFVKVKKIYETYAE